MNGNGRAKAKEARTGGRRASPHAPKGDGSVEIDFASPEPFGGIAMNPSNGGSSQLQNSWTPAAIINKWLERARTKLFPVKSKLLWPALQEQAMSAIASASEDAGPILHVATVLARAGWGDFLPEERAWIARIENRRRATNSSTEVFRYQGFMPHNCNMVFEEVVGERSRLSSKPPAEAAFLFSMVRQQKPASCIEMGTCVGISGSYIAAALRLNNCGKLISLEGIPALAEIAKHNFSALCLEKLVEVVVGPFQDTLLPTLQAASPIDFIFIDGHHDEQATQRYFAMALPFLARLCVAIFDDINWSEGMRRAWSNIIADPQCTARFSLRGFGIAVLRGADNGADLTKFR